MMLTLSDEIVLLPTKKGGGASSRGSHRLAAITDCEEQWRLRYKELLRPTAEPEFRLVGTLVHTVLAYYYAGQLASPIKPTWYTKETLQEALIKDGEGRPACIRAAKEIATAYIQNYGDNDPWVPYSVEEEYRARIGDLDPGGPDATLDDEVITCRTDLIVESGGLWAVDHKTQGGKWGQQGLEAWQETSGYGYAWQAQINLKILRANGIDVQGFIINRIKRVKPYDFKRNTLHVSPLEYAEIGRVARAQVAKERELNARLAAGGAATKHPWACEGKFGLCDYVRLCKADDLNAQIEALQNGFERLSE